MLKRILLVLLSVCPLSNIVAADNVDQYRAVVEVRYDRGDESWTGSGTLVAQSNGRALILSCRHVTPVKGATVTVVWHGVDGQATKGEVVAVVERERMFKWFRFRGRRDRWVDIGNQFETDLSMIETKYPGKVKPVPVVEFSEDDGPWDCVGYAEGKLHKAVADEANWNNGVIHCNTYFLSGNSGGAMFNKDGHLVGVLAGTAKDKSYGVVSDGPNMHDLLEGFGKKW